MKVIWGLYGGDNYRDRARFRLSVLGLGFGLGVLLVSKIRGA